MDTFFQKNALLRSLRGYSRGWRACERGFNTKKMTRKIGKDARAGVMFVARIAIEGQREGFPLTFTRARARGDLLYVKNTS